MPEKPIHRQQHLVESPTQVLVETKKDAVIAIPWYFRPELLDLLKWCVGTVGLTLVGLWINSDIQNKESLRQSKKDEVSIEINKIDADAKVIEAISSKFDTTQINQYKYLIYLRPYVQTKKLATSIDLVIDQLSKNLHLGKYLKTIDIGNENANKVSAKQKVAFTKDTKVRSFKPQSNIISDEKAVAPNLLPVQTSDAIVNKIQSVRETSIPPTLENYALKGPPQTFWCKKGYFIQYNNALQIGLNNLNDSSINARVTDLQATGDNLIDPNLPILNGGHVEVFSKDKKFKYLISLDYIGNAGINPFKKAAYITVSTYGLVQ